jgi:hypothetical protein
MASSPLDMQFSKDHPYENDKDETDTVIIETQDPDPYLYVSASQPTNLTAEFWCKKIKLNNELERMILQENSNSNSSQSSFRNNSKSLKRRKRTKLLTPLQNSASKDLNKDLLTSKDRKLDLRGTKTPDPSMLGFPQSVAKSYNYYYYASKENNKKGSNEAELKKKLKRYKQKILQKEKAKSIFRFFRGTGSAEKPSHEPNSSISFFSPSQQKQNYIALFEIEPNSLGDKGEHKRSGGLLGNQSNNESQELLGMLIEKWKAVNKEPPEELVTAYTLCTNECTLIQK